MTDYLDYPTWKERKEHMAKKTEESALVVAGEIQNTVANTDGIIEALTPDFLVGVKFERTIALEDGQTVRGVFMGPGAPVEMDDPSGAHDPETGEVKRRLVKTWRLEAKPGIVVRMLGSSRLDAEFGQLKADGSVRVRVARIGQKSTRRGRRVTDYVVAVEV